MKRYLASRVSVIAVMLWALGVGFWMVLIPIAHRWITHQGWVARWPIDVFLFSFLVPLLILLYIQVLSRC